MLGKAPGLGADMVFLDLEDAVAPLEKPGARAKVVNAINTLDFGDAVLCVRVNAWDTEWTYRDVNEVVEGASERLDELMLPKVECAADVHALMREVQRRVLEVHGVHLEPETRLVGFDSDSRLEVEG